MYGARVFNLYRVKTKVAYDGAELLPPWPPVTFRPSGITYYFPYRLYLTHLRDLNEPLVRAEFAYVAENLLLRGGYRKTHFQADQTTLQAVSEMGNLTSRIPESLDLPYAVTFQPRLTASREQSSPPRVLLFRELFLQAAVRKYLSVSDNLESFFVEAAIGQGEADAFEVLSEKAFPEGHVDLLIKDATPKGGARKVIAELKLGSATTADVQQTRNYARLLGNECLGAVLIARSHSRRVQERAREAGISLLRYETCLSDEPCTFGEIVSSLRLERSQ